MLFVPSRLTRCALCVLAATACLLFAPSAHAAPPTKIYQSSKVRYKPMALGVDGKKAAFSRGIRLPSDPRTSNIRTKFRVSGVRLPSTTLARATGSGATVNRSAASPRTKFPKSRNAFSKHFKAPFVRPMVKVGRR